jgi:hypothetical protein
MKKWIWIAAGLVLVLTSRPVGAEAQLSAGVVLDRDGLRGLHVAIGQVYRAPVREVQRWGPARIHPDELPVVYFLAREARVSPEAVIALRDRGWSWMDVSRHLGLSPQVFVRHLPRQGPPYGRAHGYWARENRDLYRLSDRQIVDYVNLAFWADYHRQPVARVIQVREDRGAWERMVTPVAAGPRGVQMKESAGPGRGRGGPPPGRGRPGRGPGDWR